MHGYGEKVGGGDDPCCMVNEIISNGPSSTKGKSMIVEFREKLHEMDPPMATRRRWEVSRFKQVGKAKKLKENKLQL